MTMPATDIENLLVLQKSSPIRIYTPRLPARDDALDDDMPIPKLDHDAMREKARKRKKNKKKGMLLAAPALNVVKGFQTPVHSGGEESDASTVGTPRLGATKMSDISSVTSSPALRPGTPGNGFSILRARLDALDLESTNNRPSLVRAITSESDLNGAVSSSGGSDADRTELETYDVPLEQEFVSTEFGTRTSLSASQAIGAGLRSQSIHRKMCAEDFQPLRCLGKGAFGTVHLVRQAATGRLYAQKQFKKASITVHKRLIEQTRTERTILESVNRHPFVVKLYYAFQDQEKLYLILEYAQGGELFTHLAMERMFTEEVAAFYMAEMVLALDHLHQNVRVIYRDLKPENCLLDTEGHLLLTDFGLSKVALDDEGGRTNSILGTIEYMAPEVIEGKDYDFAVDWWSLGAIGFDLLTGSPPFGGNNHAKIQQNILKQKLQLPYFLGPDAKDFLTRLLRKEPQKRLGGCTGREAKTLKAHRFFRKIDWKKLEKRELEPPIQPLITDPALAENFSKDFTDLPLSPVFTRNSKGLSDVLLELGGVPTESNPFGGFSYVASRSLLDDDDLMLDD